MLSLNVSGGSTLCDRVSRRELLRVGGLGLGLGAGLSLPTLTALTATPARAAEATPVAPAVKPKAGGSKFGRAKSVIVFHTNGGIAQMDSFDPKPDSANAESRGENGTVPTAIPGIRFSDPWPRLAKIADRVTILRAVNHKDPVHPPAIYQSLTGKPLPRQVTPESATGSREDRPHFGAVVAKVQGGRPDLPSWVMLPAAMGPNGPEWPGQFAGFLGPAYDPYWVKSDPAAPGFDPGALAADAGLSPQRVAGRRALLDTLRRQSEALDRAAATRSLDPHYAKAFDIIASPAAQKAFDLSAEKDAVRDRYGRHTLGQGLLLARRLVEAGVRLVQVNGIRSNVGPGGQGWDTHRTHYESSRKLYPTGDQAVSALIEDLDARGLLGETVVVLMNEFGRTVRINPNGGRDHWPQVYSLLLAGGGLTPGAVYGASDANGAYPADGAVSPAAVLATIYHLLGVDHNGVIEDHLGRPHHIMEADPIHAVL
jgi:hypothetical protein